MEKGTSDRTRQGAAGNPEEALESLFRHASSRPEPSQEDRRAVRVAVREQWRDVTGRRRRRRVVGLSLAASAVLATVLVLFRLGSFAPDPVHQEIAKVEKVTGRVRMLAEGAGGAGTIAGRKMSVFAGHMLSTGSDSGVALRLASGISLRLDQDSELVLVDSETVELGGGRVYVDTGVDEDAGKGPQSQASRLAIETPYGTVRHLGTQYMIRAAIEGLSVSVREGVVQFQAKTDTGGSPVYVPDGKELSVDEFGQQAISAGDRHGERWRWVEALGPVFELDGRTMAEFLEWVGSETGFEIVYETDAAKVIAEDTVLHGEVDLPARQAVEVVLRTSDLAADFREGVIQVSIKP